MIITLTTDFGGGSPYIAAMKGTMLRINPALTLVDVTHDIPPQNVLHGGLVLREAAHWFPPGAIHLAVIDPGVGTDRAILAAEIDGQFFVAPDNGLLDPLASTASAIRVVRLDRPEHWLPEVSRTFHGRDVMSPVAARISLGLSLSELGTASSTWKKLEIPRPIISPTQITGCVLYADSFGNLITNITTEHLAAIARPDAVARVLCDEHLIEGISQTYAEHLPGALIALIGSARQLELAIVNGNAAATLNVSAGQTVAVTF